jgi:hypothetical protein
MNTYEMTLRKGNLWATTTKLVKAKSGDEAHEKMWRKGWEVLSCDLIQWG